MSVKTVNNNGSLEHVFELNKTEIINLVNAYAHTVVALEKDGEELSWEEYNYDEGYINAFEFWMQTIGVHPESSFVRQIINKVREDYEEE